jgi:hypothetical protein
VKSLINKIVRANRWSTACWSLLTEALHFTVLIDTELDAAAINVAVLIAVRCPQCGLSAALVVMG